MATATEIGNDIGGLLGGMFNPLLGTTTTYETATPSQSSRTGTIVIAILAIATVAVVGYLLLKNKSAA